MLFILLNCFYYFLHVDSIDSVNFERILQFWKYR